MANANTCVSCGVVIPEGIQVCKVCLNGVTDEVTNVRETLKNSAIGTFISVGDVTVYKTIDSFYKVSSYCEGTVLVNLEKAIELVTK